MASEREEWRCFHCDEVFTDRRCAVDHFGAHEGCEPACQIKMGAERSMLTALRRAEQDAANAWQAIQNETTDAAKAYYAQNARHQGQLRIAEELGFERGMAAVKGAASTLSAQDGRIERLTKALGVARRVIVDQQRHETDAWGIPGPEWGEALYDIDAALGEESP